MDAPDAVVLASVIGHLQSSPTPESCFPNKNWKDFFDPSVEEELRNYGCKLFRRFDKAHDFVMHKIGAG
jgi:hypothetical protein